LARFSAYRVLELRTLKREPNRKHDLSSSALMPVIHPKLLLARLQTDFQKTP
jgi:hypothetical protein